MELAVEPDRRGDLRLRPGRCGPCPAIPGRQERAIAEIDRLGGYIGARRGQASAPPPAAGPGGHVGRRAVADADHVRLAWLPDLDALYLEAGLTDAGLEHLRPLTGLEELELAETELTDAGLGPILELHRLESLTLHGPVTDRGLGRLASLGNLRGLWLSGSKVTDSGLVHLISLPHLESLGLPGAGSPTPACPG